MAMISYNKVVENSKSMNEEKHEEKSEDKVTAIAEYRNRLGKAGDELYIRYIEASFLVPDFGKSQKLKLNNLCEKIDCYYIIKDIDDKELLKKGLTKRIIVAVSPVEDNSQVKKLNQFFGITNYTS